MGSKGEETDQVVKVKLNYQSFTEMRIQNAEVSEAWLSRPVDHGCMPSHLLGPYLDMVLLWQISWFCFAAQGRIWLKLGKQAEQRVRGTLEELQKNMAARQTQHGHG